MSCERFFYLTNGELTVHRWEKGAWRTEGVFGTDTEAQERFAGTIAGRPDLTSCLLTDVIEEEYRNETIPYIIGPERKAVLERKQRQLFRNTPYRSVRVQGREKTERHHIRALFTALTNPDALQPWLALLDRLKVPLAGIHSVAAVSERLLRKLKIDHPNTLLLTEQCGGQLRQSFFSGFDLKASRLSPMTARERGEQLEFLSHEIDKNQRYLNRLQILPQGARLDICILTHGEWMERLREGLRDTDLLHYHLIDIDSAAHKLGLKESPPADRCDRLFVHLLRGFPGAPNYARPPERRYHLMRRARTGVIAASLLSAVGSAAWSLGNLMEAADLDDRAALAGRDIERLERENRAAEAALPETPATPAEMQAAVETFDALSRHKAEPRTLLVALSKGLAVHPRIHVQGIEWHAADHPGEENEGEWATEETGEGEKPRYQIALLKGYLEPAGGDYGEAFKQVNGFIRTLRQDRSFVEVEASEMPLNVDPEALLSGDSARRGKESAAQFEIRAVMRIGHDRV